MYGGIFFALGCLSVATSHVCRSAEELEPFFRHDYFYFAPVKAFYKEHKDALGWREAISMCSLEGAELVMPTSKEEVNLLITFVSSTTNHVWIGLHDLYTELHYATINEVPSSEIYLNHPDPNPGEGRDCVRLLHNGQYSDGPCDVASRFICRKDFNTVAANAECGYYDLEYKKLNPSDDSCYKFHPMPRTWHDAFKTCSEEEAYLVILNSREEAQSCLDVFKKLGKKPENNLKTHMWFGFSSLVIPTQFKTIEGQTLMKAGYDEWAIGEPNNYGDNEHCGCMSVTDDGLKLHDLPCNDELQYMCERKISSIKRGFSSNTIPKLNKTQPACDPCSSGYKRYPYMPDSCYKLHTTARSWNDAFKVCAAEKAHLIILNSAEEAKFCADTFIKYVKSTPEGNFKKNHIMVGFSNLQTPAEHRTVDGKTLSEAGYDNWRRGIPSGAGEHCGALTQHPGTLQGSFELNVIPCAHFPLLFMCEKNIN